MTGTWPGSRAALVAQLDGVEATVAGYTPGTLSCLEFPPSAKQRTPYAFVWSPEQQVERHSASNRVTTLDVEVQLLVAAEGTKPEDAMRLWEAWVDALKDALDDALALDSNADIWEVQRFSKPGVVEDWAAWGGVMTLEGLRISEVKTFGA